MICEISFLFHLLKTSPVSINIGKAVTKFSEEITLGLSVAWQATSVLET